MKSLGWHTQGPSNNPITEASIWRDSNFAWQSYGLTVRQFKVKLELEWCGAGGGGHRRAVGGAVVQCKWV